MNHSTREEVDFLLAGGLQKVSLREIESRLRNIGYRLDRRMDCKCVARTISGPREGTSHMALSLYPVEADSGRSASHVDARRDANFGALTELRHGFFAVVDGHIAML